jgi:hypothetical protein
MAMDLAQTNGNEIDNGRDTLFMLSGVALMVFGAGLVLSNSYVRRYMSQLGVGNLAQAVMPDVERYFRLRAM